METKSSNPTIESAYIIYAQFIDIKNQDINQNLFTPYSYKNKNGYLYIESNKNLPTMIGNILGKLNHLIENPEQNLETIINTLGSITFIIDNNIMEPINSILIHNSLGIISKLLFNTSKNPIQNKIGLLDDLEKIQIALLNQNYYDLPYLFQEL